MKVVTQTQSQLVLKQSAFGNIAFGVLLLVMGLFIATRGGNTALIGGSFFTVAGIGIIFISKFITIVMDKTNNQFLLTSVSLLGKKRQDLALNQIKQVSLEEYTYQTTTTNGSSKTQVTYTLVFYLQNGQGIPIPAGSAGSGIGNFQKKNKLDEIGNIISAFIGVPFIDKRPPSISDVISGVVKQVNQAAALNESLPQNNSQPQ